MANLQKKEYETRRLQKEADDAKVIEIAMKTHKFFTVKKVGTGYKKVNTGVIYFGDAIEVKQAWIPHGEGEYKVGPQVFYSGSFFHGKMHGPGEYLFANFDLWKGTFRFDDLHGVGMLEVHAKEGEDDPPPRECIFHKNRRVCFTDELVVGQHIKFYEPVKHNAGATIMGETSKRGHFRVKMDDGGLQSVNLAEVGFKLDLAAARVTLLEEFVPKAGEKGATRDGTFAEERYSYQRDVLLPTYTDHDENWYSSKPIPVDDNVAAALAAKRKAAWETRQKAKEDIKLNAAKDAEIDKAKEEKKAAEEEAKKEAEAYEEEMVKAKEEILEKREAANQEMERRKTEGKKSVAEGIAAANQK